VNELLVILAGYGVRGMVAPFPYLNLTYYILIKKFLVSSPNAPNELQCVNRPSVNVEPNPKTSASFLSRKKGQFLKKRLPWVRPIITERYEEPMLGRRP
jgi:hypothetical protein